MIHYISGFDIIEKIGEGGMASVWKARQVSLDRIVAIKILADRFSSSSDDIRHFLDEAQSSAKLKHSGIVQVYDARAENGIYCFIMEHVDGYTVGEWVRRKGQLSEPDVLLVAECIADALSYAWERAGIIHCDIKPDNVIIDEDGTVKVADLGLARTISMMGCDSEVPAEISGTPAYISPEQASGAPNLDFRTDIYALGAMLYHLVTGKMVFEGASQEEMLEKQKSDTVDDPLDINAALSKGFCWLVERMMAKDPDLRQESWEAVREDIIRVKRGLFPRGRVLPEGASTVRRSQRRTVSEYQRMAQLQKAYQVLTTPMVVRAALIAGTVVVALTLGFRLYMRKPQPLPTPVTPVAPVTNVAESVEAAPETTPGVNANDASEMPEVEASAAAERSDDAAPEPPTTPATDASAEPSGDQAETLVSDMYAFAESWHEEHPEDLRGAIEKFETVARETRGTKYSLMAQERVRELVHARQEAVQDAMHSLRRQWHPLADAHAYDEAIAVLSTFEGPYAAATRSLREHIIDRLRRQKATWMNAIHREEQAVEQHRNQRFQAVADAVLADELLDAMDMVADMMEEPQFRGWEESLATLHTVLRKTSEIDQRILDSFRDQQGETINITFVDGARELKVVGILGDKVECKQLLSIGGGVVSTVYVWVDDLSMRERLQRMGPDSLPEVALAKGIMAYKAHSFSHARKYFSMTHPEIAARLLKRLEAEAGFDDGE